MNSNALAAAALVAAVIPSVAAGAAAAQPRDLFGHTTEENGGDEYPA